jgi:hypothetical protein
MNTQPENEFSLREALAQQIQSIKRQVLAPCAHGEPREEHYPERNLTERILGLLDQDPTRFFSPRVVADTLEEKNRIASVRSTLIRLADDHKVDRPKKGEYRAKRRPSDTNGNGFDAPVED